MGDKRENTGAGQGSEAASFARLTPEECLQRLGVCARGLPESEADEILLKIGPNSLIVKKKMGWARRLAAQIINPLNLMMASLVVVNAVWLDNLQSAILISIMIALSVGLSVLQEGKSDQAAARLQSMVRTLVSCVRPEGAGERVTDVPLSRLVPGDVIVLSAGSIIPADVRIIEATDLFIDQSAMTGESLPVEKTAQAQTREAPTPQDLANIAFMGSHVTSGKGRAVVIATGPRTAFGSLAQDIAKDRTKTAFEKGMSRFTWMMIGFMGVMAPLVFALNGWMKGDWTEAFMFAVAIAVGMTPEMLPMIVAVNLGKGAVALSRKKLIVKRLGVIQNFGAMDILCTDKTGTLTQDKVIMKRHLNLKGEACQDVLVHAYLNSYFQSGMKNLLDLAVLEHEDLAFKLQLDRVYRRIDEIPFDFERRRLSVVLAKDETRHVLICKGAAEEVMQVCARVDIGGIVSPLDAAKRSAAEALKTELNEDGFRVVAVATKTMPADRIDYTKADEADLTLLGFVAFLDPPKDSAAAALTSLRGYGIAVKILTGDNAVVTRKICKDVGLPILGILSGDEIAAMDPVQFAEKAKQTTIFAKVSPAQKAQIIRVLQEAGHVVGFLGDGINDGPALKIADVGLSVDTGADIAKESASIILLEKSLMVLCKGVIEGRCVFTNILKYIRMGASSSFGNMLSLLGASVWLPFLPMAPVQILANSLLYDMSQTAIPMDHIDNDDLAQPLKWDLRGVAKFMLTMGPVSSLFDYATFGVLYYVYQANTGSDASFFQSAWFVESILSQTLIIHIIRTRKIPFIESKPSRSLLASSLLICAVGAWLPFSPFAMAFGFTALPWTLGPVIAVIVALYLLLAYAVKGRIEKGAMTV